MRKHFFRFYPTTRGSDLRKKEKGSERLRLDAGENLLRTTPSSVTEGSSSLELLLSSV